MATINRMEFTPEEIEKGCLSTFMDFVLKFNKIAEKSYITLAISTDGYCTIVDFVQNIPEDAVQPVFIGEDQVVYRTIHLPDGSYQDVIDNQGEIQAFLEEWHKKHPEWVHTGYGTWTNTEENEAFRKSWEKEIEEK